MSTTRSDKCFYFMDNTLHVADKELGFLFLESETFLCRYFDSLKFSSEQVLLLQRNELNLNVSYFTAILNTLCVVSSEHKI